ncbi:MAG: hypothetical protein MUO88_16715, partial [Desulfobacterales bacterium]|nr:hypothetical protein [Desulfobacterales bacterium]
RRPALITLSCRAPSFIQPAPPLCTLHGFDFRVSAGVDYRIGDVAEGAGEKRLNQKIKKFDNDLCSYTEIVGKVMKTNIS